MTERLWNAYEVAAPWNVSPDHVRQLLRSGVLRGVRITPKLWRIPFDAILECEQCRTRG
jgi:excisionase family DNA binding protein